MAENFNSTTPLNGIWVLCQLIPFLIEIVVSKIDVRLILTDEIKETIIY